MPGSFLRHRETRNVAAGQFATERLDHADTASTPSRGPLGQCPLTPNRDQPLRHGGKTRRANRYHQAGKASLRYAPQDFGFLEWRLVLSHSIVRMIARGREGEVHEYGDSLSNRFL
jgi:hypothetical protein